MPRVPALLAVAFAAAITTGSLTLAQTPPEITLARLVCGTGAPPFPPSPRFNDTYALRRATPCYW